MKKLSSFDSISFYEWENLKMFSSSHKGNENTGMIINL